MTNRKLPSITLPIRGRDNHHALTAVAEAVRSMLGQGATKTHAVPTWYDLLRAGVVVGNPQAGYRHNSVDAVVYPSATQLAFSVRSDLDGLFSAQLNFSYPERLEDWMIDYFSVHYSTSSDFDSAEFYGFTRTMPFLVNGKMGTNVYFWLTIVLKNGTEVRSTNSTWVRFGTLDSTTDSDDHTFLPYQPQMLPEYYFARNYREQLALKEVVDSMGEAFRYKVHSYRYELDDIRKGLWPKAFSSISSIKLCTVEFPDTPAWARRVSIHNLYLGFYTLQDSYDFSATVEARYSDGTVTKSWTVGRSGGVVTAFAGRIENREFVQPDGTVVPYRTAHLDEINCNQGQRELHFYLVFDQVYSDAGGHFHDFGIYSGRTIDAFGSSVTSTPEDYVTVDVWCDSNIAYETTIGIGW